MISNFTSLTCNTIDLFCNGYTDPDLHCYDNRFKNFAAENYKKPLLIADKPDQEQRATVHFQYFTLTESIMELK